jgi:4,5:9,10-diseco-3-hydroxy-5,9,17-trioxoandrosta-1(10),2-diene-4-oate hydrolase
MTAAIGSFLDAVHLRDTVLAGNSWSGGWALAYAQRYPERVSRLVLLAPSGLAQPDPLSWELLKLPLVGRALTNLTLGSRSATEAQFASLVVHKDRAPAGLAASMWAAATLPDNVRATYELEAHLTVMAESVRGARIVTRVIDAPVDEVWGRLSDLDGDFGRIQPDMRHVRVQFRVGEQVEALARSRFGMRARLRGVLRPGWAGCKAAS